MADTKISALTALLSADVALTDLLAIVDTSASETKKIAVTELLALLRLLLTFDVDTVTATDASYTPNALQVIVLNNASTDVDITFASALPEGTVIIAHAIDNGATDHRIELGGSQTFDGTNNIAVFNAANDRAVWVVISSTLVVEIYNNSVTYTL